jgi:hypothetical protein
MDKKRSIGLTVIGILLIVWPFLYLLRMVFSSSGLSRHSFFYYLPDVSNPVLFFQKLLFIVSGIGILMLKKWARILTLCISLYGIIIWILAIAVKSHLSLTNKAAHIIFYASLCWLLALPRIKERFR